MFSAERLNHGDTIKGADVKVPWLPAPHGFEGGFLVGFIVNRSGHRQLWLQAYLLYVGRQGPYYVLRVSDKLAARQCLVKKRS